MKNCFFAWSRLGVFGVILNMQLQPPQHIDDLLHGARDCENMKGNAALSRPCIEDHGCQLRNLFDILAYYKLSLKPDKRKTFVTRMKLIGHIPPLQGRY